MTLSDIEFEYVPSFTLTPVEMSYHGVGDALFEPPSPKQVFGDAVYLIPTKIHYAGGATNYSYAGFVGITDEVADSDLADPHDRCSAILDRLETWADDHPHGAITTGVFASSSDVCPGVSDGGYHLPEEHVGYNVAAANLPRKSVAHEITRGIGRPHAGNDPVCYSSEDASLVGEWTYDPSQLGEWWFPDQRGRIEGIGLDTRAGSGGASAPYRVIVPAAALPGGPLQNGQFIEWIDYMSYCADEANSWVSTRGWNDAIQDLQVFGGASRPRSQNRARAVAEPGPSLRVAATASSAGVHIFSVERGRGHPLRGAASNYHLVSRSADGALIADAAMRATSPHLHQAARHLLLEGLAPTSAASIEIVRNGAVVAQRIRSATAPQLAIHDAVARVRVAGRAGLGISWSATDADGDNLDASVDYSTDDGGHWETIVMGARKAGVELPVTAFRPSTRARVRVNVNDGFNETSAVSGCFVVAARPPSVRIASPARGERVRSDATLYLQGEAYDDRGSAVASRHLQWFLDRRPIARGEDASAVRLPPGRHLLRLVARDVHGRLGSASVPVRVAGVAPHLLDLRAPASVGPRARRLTFSVATTIPATLMAAGRRYAVGRGLRNVAVPIRPGRGPLRISLRLVADGKVTRTRLVVPRRASG
jgi:hypothetical protein